MTETLYRKKLIDISLPLEAINEASVAEKFIRTGHPSVLHQWWSRKPLVTARAVLFASLVDDPSEYLVEEDKVIEERERLLKLLRQLALWENSNNQDILDQTRLEIARSLAAKATTIGSTPAIVENLGAADGDLLQSIADALRGQFKGVVVLGGTANNAVALVATVAPELTKKFQAGKIIQAIAPIVGGKGGGRPDNARGGGKDASKLDEALAKARNLVE